MNIRRLIIAIAMLAFAPTALAVQRPKYVFVFIGDGMSTPQRMVAEEFAEKTGHGELAMNRLPYQVNTRTRSANSVITDSAAAATAIACGVKTNNGMLGVLPDGTEVESVAEVAKRSGMKVGIVTTTAINHATPAGFYAHRKSRSEGYRIGLDLVSSGFDYFAGGGFNGKEDDRSNSQYRGNIYDLARNAGYSVATNVAAWAALRPGGKALCTFASHHFAFAIDRDPAVQPALSELVGKGIELLDNPNGFFIMCEGGTLDFAGHANDAATNLRDAIALDAAVKVALAFAEKHPGETLVIATGDHETGGLSMGFVGTGGKFYVERLACQKCSTEKFSGGIKEMLRRNINITFDEIRPLVTEKYGLVFDGDPKDPMSLTSAEVNLLKEAFEKDRQYVKAKLADTVAHDVRRRYVFASTARGILAAHAGVGWSSGSHTALPTLTTATGTAADIIVGMAENADIGIRLKKLLGASPAK